MDDAKQGMKINAIINVLNTKIKRDNKVKVNQGLYHEQQKLHGGDMFLTLAFMDDDHLQKIYGEATR
jgi:hypothetical protein